MGLDIGTIQISFLPRPRGIAYRFAQDLAVELSGWGSYMWGEGNGWAPLTQRQALRHLSDFARFNGLTPEQRDEILAWLRSLPWLGGWRDNLRVADRPGKRPSDRDPHIDRHWTDGGLIELYFNW